MADTDRNRINTYLKKKKIYKCYLKDFHLTSLKLKKNPTALNQVGFHPSGHITGFWWLKAFLKTLCLSVSEPLDISENHFIGNSGINTEAWRERMDT